MRLLILSAVLAVTTVLSAQQTNPFLGRWNMTGTGTDAANVYWLEITEEQGTLKGMFLNRVGNPVPLTLVKIDGAELVFQEGSAERPRGPEYRARIEDGKLVGRHAVQIGGRGRRGADPAATATTTPTPTPTPPPPTERIVNWVGVRPPVWPERNANGNHEYGTPVVLFDGTAADASLDAWGIQNPNRPIGWSVVDGAMTNVRGANNLVSKATFQDFKIEAEYKLSEGTNSGIYLRGRYELQILDDAASTTGRPDLGHMAIYGRTPPSVKASKPAGEVQTMSAVIVGNRVTVTLNGQRVHDNAIIHGITGGALDNKEAEPGPLLIQGDHYPVSIRKIVVTPIVTPGR